MVALLFTAEPEQSAFRAIALLHWKVKNISLDHEKCASLPSETKHFAYIVKKRSDGAILLQE